MDEKKLELRLGPPGDEEYPAKTCVGAKRGFFATVEPNTGSILPPHATENAAEGQRSSRTRRRGPNFEISAYLAYKQSSTCSAFEVIQPNFYHTLKFVCNLARIIKGKQT
ncbi:uncharacterized protein LOC109826432 [Asparagus officinalis]|uniref:uncharacterized protein LOC109826432 n=1 Tax=Asparagus officinalis TaxID=4686 RepID=UPI00098E8138|nr:uncharacterized protein LOC109826432 [Asparagus officinalis]